ncbi:hypothetical protein OESDEN_17046, partial [Oesophagostomum dentatum]
AQKKSIAEHHTEGITQHYSEANSSTKTTYNAVRTSNFLADDVTERVIPPRIAEIKQPSLRSRVSAAAEEKEPSSRSRTPATDEEETALVLEDLDSVLEKEELSFEQKPNRAENLPNRPQVTNTADEPEHSQSSNSVVERKLSSIERA